MFGTLHRLDWMTSSEWEPFQGLSPLPGHQTPQILRGGWWYAHSDGQAYAAEVMVGTNDDDVPVVMVWVDMDSHPSPSVPRGPVPNQGEYKQFSRTFPTNDQAKEAELLALILGRLTVCDQMTLRALGFDELA